MKYVFINLINAALWFFAGWMFGKARELRRSTKQVEELRQQVNATLKLCRDR